jgi:hypothetical protein
MRLVDKRRGALPLIELKDDYYNDVKNVLECFKGSSTIDLDELYIEGVVNLTGVKQFVKDAIPEAMLADLRTESDKPKSRVGKVILSLISKAKTTEELSSKILGLSVEDIRNAINEVKDSFVKADKSAWTDADSLQLETLVFKKYLNIKANAIKNILFRGDQQAFFGELIANSSSAITKITKGKRTVQREVKETVKVLKPFEIEKTEMVDKVETIEKTIIPTKLKNTPDNEQTYLRDEYKGKLKIVPAANGKLFFANDERLHAVVELNGVRIPFYQSSGNVPKYGIIPGRWYPILGVGDEWINKLNDESMRSYVLSPAVRAMAEFLLDNVKPEDGFDYSARPTKDELKLINEGFNPFQKNKNLDPNKGPVDPADVKQNESNVLVLFNRVKQIEGEGYGQAKVVKETVITKEPRVVKVIEQRELEAFKNDETRLKAALAAEKASAEPTAEAAK